MVAKFSDSRNPPAFLLCNIRNERHIICEDNCRWENECFGISINQTNEDENDKNAVNR